ncbi:MAG: YigZ family protein [Anaeroplasmataceae bacterium]|nr:YigZ family protein [Anaeroplasmataceae bacterium]
MKFIQGNYENTIVIQKSRFIAEAYRVNSLEEIEEILGLIRRKYYDASHHCFAYRLNASIQKISDDGEPAKTAGAPILDVILKQDLTNILVVVTRYFGGILLGAGGLVRAYSGATSAVLDNTLKYQVEEQIKFQITCSYSSYQTILKMMKYIKIEKTSFLTEVTLQGYCKKNMFHKIKEDCFTYKIGDTQIMDLGVFPIEVPVDTLTE